MSTAEPTSIDLAEPRPLQTFLAPTEACPIPLSVLWMPISQPNGFETSLKTVCRFILSDHLISENPTNALRYFFEGTITSEQQLIRSTLKLSGESHFRDAYFPLMRYAIQLEDWRREMIGVPTDILNTTIVISRSPLSEELLGKLLASGAIGLGYYTGYSIIPPEANPYLMLSCISGGIICISTAAGIGRALQDGLYKTVLRLFGDTSERKKKRK